MLIGSMRQRILIATGIGLVSGILCGSFLAHFHLGAGDFNWAIWAAKDLWAGRNPYVRPGQLYPLTAAPFGFPLAWLPPSISGGAFYGVSSACLAFAVTTENYDRLFIFLSFPYWAGLVTAQWSPLILASAFLPWLLPACIAKPQIGLPVALIHPSRRGWLACGVLAAVSFAIMPDWPRGWAHSWTGYNHFFPLLVFPGVLLVLALLRFRDPDARFLLLSAVFPQRYFYDPLVLWCIPKSRRQIMWTVTLSWIAWIWRWFHTSVNDHVVGRWIVLCMYLPMLAVILLRRRGTAESRHLTSLASPAA